MLANEFLDSKIQWEGPSWLNAANLPFIIETKETIPLETIPEAKNTVKIFIITRTEFPILISNYSNLTRVKRMNFEVYKQLFN